MGIPLQVLIVEDVEDDALLMLRELEKGGYDPIHQRVETAEAMKRALQEKSWDIILSDYHLPRFTGLQALMLFKETGDRYSLHSGFRNDRRGTGGGGHEGRGP